MTKEQLKKKVLKEFENKDIGGVGSSTDFNDSEVKEFISETIDKAVEETYKAVKPEKRTVRTVDNWNDEDRGLDIERDNDFNEAIELIENNYKEFNN